MRDADIKIWVLTGDKVGTARSIARSCKLIEHGMDEYLVDESSSDAVQKQLDAIELKLGITSNHEKTGRTSLLHRKSKIESSSLKPDTPKSNKTLLFEKPDKYMLVTGAALYVLAHNADLEKKASFSLHYWLLLAIL